MNSKVSKDGKKYQGYSAATTDTEARAAFKAKFGRDPQEIRRNGGGVLAGPLTVQEANHD